MKCFEEENDIASMACCLSGKRCAMTVKVHNDAKVEMEASSQAASLDRANENIIVG